MITHTVVFNLKHTPNSPEESLFLEQAKALASIDGVQNFKVHKQVSPKNPYTYGLFMDFQSQEDYDAYNNHPQHIDFVENVWLVEVEQFLELDYELLEA